jgi:hypothetical protein
MQKYLLFKKIANFFAKKLVHIVKIGDINIAPRASLFRGASSTLESVAVSNFVYFYTFHGLKKLAGASAQQNAGKDLVFACVAGQPLEDLYLFIKY